MQEKQLVVDIIRLRWNDSSTVIKGTKTKVVNYFFKCVLKEK